MGIPRLQGRERPVGKINCVPTRSASLQGRTCRVVDMLNRSGPCAGDITALNGLHSSANSAAAQGNMIQNEQLFMAQLNTMNQQQNGLDQGLQIGNAVGLETVAQLQRLRMLTIANIQQNAVMATTVLNAQQANVTTRANQFTDTGLGADQRGW